MGDGSRATGIGFAWAKFSAFASDECFFDLECPPGAQPVSQGKQDACCGTDIAIKGECHNSGCFSDAVKDANMPKAAKPKKTLGLLGKAAWGCHLFKCLLPDNKHLISQLFQVKTKYTTE